MQLYSDIDHDSDVAEYEAGGDFIRIRFRGGATYLYTYRSAGAENIERMKALAISGDGLNAFINRYVRRGYERKEAWAMAAITGCPLKWRSSPIATFPGWNPF